MIIRIVNSVYGYFRRTHGVADSISMTIEATGLPTAKVRELLGFS